MTLSMDGSMRDANDSADYSGSGSGAADLCEDAEVPLASQIARAGVYVAAMLVSLLANSLLICVVRRNRRMRTVTHQLIVNMAVADLLITVLHMPYMLQVQLTDSHRLHLSGTLATVVCKVAGFSQDLSIACSVLSLVAIALDRFFAILYPLKKVATFSTAGPLVAAVWLVSLAVCAPLLYANKTERSDGELYCVEDWAPAFDDVTASRDYTVAVFVLLYACPVLLLCTLYTSIVVRVWRRAVLPRASKHRRSTRKKVLKLLMAIVCVFVICWLPYHVLFFMENFAAAYSDCPVPQTAQFACRFFGHVNSAINPCLYFAFLRDYRRGLVAILCCQRKGISHGRDVSTALSGKQARLRFHPSISKKYTITRRSSYDRNGHQSRDGHDSTASTRPDKP